MTPASGPPAAGCASRSAWCCRTLPWRPISRCARRSPATPGITRTRRMSTRCGTRGPGRAGAAEVKHLSGSQKIRPDLRLGFKGNPSGGVPGRADDRVRPHRPPWRLPPGRGRQAGCTTVLRRRTTWTRRRRSLSRRRDGRRAVVVRGYRHRGRDSAGVVSASKVSISPRSKVGLLLPHGVRRTKELVEVEQAGFGTRQPRYPPQTRWRQARGGPTHLPGAAHSLS